MAWWNAFSQHARASCASPLCRCALMNARAEKCTDTTKQRSAGPVADAIEKAGLASNAGVDSDDETPPAQKEEETSTDKPEAPQATATSPVAPVYTTSPDEEKPVVLPEPATAAPTEGNQPEVAATSTSTAAAVPGVAPVVNGTSEKKHQAPAKAVDVKGKKPRLQWLRRLSSQDARAVKGKAAA